MIKMLVLITKTYPYGYGEPFIESEIEMLAKSFDKVVIVASAVLNSITSVRECPPNVTVLKIADLYNRRNRYAFHILHGVKYLRHPVLRAELKHQKTVKSIIAALYLYDRAQQICKTVCNALKSNRPESNIVVYSYWLSDTALAAGMLKEELVGQSVVRAVSRAHGYDLYDERNPAGCNPFRSFYINSLDSVYPCSMDGTEYLRAKFPKYSNKIDTRYLGTLDHGTQRSNAKTNDFFSIITCSNINSTKNLTLLIQALELLESQDASNITWFCVGDGSELPALKLMAKQLLRRTTVHFVGRLDNKDVLSLYKDEYFDLFINVSKNEGLPVSIMEATSFGIPVIATDVGGTREIVRNGENGFLLGDDVSPEALANSISQFKNMGQDETSKYRDAARRIWQEVFNASRNYEQFSIEISQPTKMGVCNV